MAKKKSIGKSTTTAARTQSQITPVPMPGSFYGPNTITLSADMSTLYLIDGGRAIPYSLDAIGGVLIGEIKGQLTVVSALDPFPMDDKEIQSFSFDERSVGTPIPTVKSAKIPTSRGQWNFLHLRERKQVCIIGAVDINIEIKEGSSSLELQGYLFDLRESFINIQKFGNTITIDSIPVTF
jgi:hypothetical protein